MTTRPLSAAACAVAIASLAACASRPAEYPSTYGPPGPVVTQPPAYPQSAAYAEYGTVSTVEVMPVASRTTGAGAILGAVIGAAIGNQFGAGTGRAAATVGGAVAGGVAGNAIEHRQKRDDEVFHVGVRFDDGSFREFDFQRVDDLRVGDRVKWEGGQLYRL